MCGCLPGEALGPCTAAKVFACHRHPYAVYVVYGGPVPIDNRTCRLYYLWFTYAQCNDCT